MNKHHPEQTEFQIYMGNVPKQDADRIFSRHIGWFSTSYGKIAYDINGNIINGMVPCFVQKTEIESAIKIQKYEIEMRNNPPGCKENIEVWQKMLDSGTVFYDKTEHLSCMEN